MRRRALAASVVVTVSLAELACTSPQELDTKKPPAPEPIDHNPPDPGAGEKPPEEKPPEEIPGDKVTIEKMPDGSCWESFDTNCPEDAKCNPPRPREVQCPKEIELPTAKNPGTVRVRDNGEGP